MDWFVSLLTNTSGVGHIVMLYAFVIAVGIALGRVKIGGKKNGIALGVTSSCLWESCWDISTRVRALFLRRALLPQAMC